MYGRFISPRADNTIHVIEQNRFINCQTFVQAHTKYGFTKCIRHPTTQQHHDHHPSCERQMDSSTLTWMDNHNASTSLFVFISNNRNPALFQLHKDTNCPFQRGGKPTIHQCRYCVYARKDNTEFYIEQKPAMLVSPLSPQLLRFLNTL